MQTKCWQSETGGDVTLDPAGNVRAVNNWRQRFGTDFPLCDGNPGGDGIVILVGMARPPAASKRT